MKSNQIDSVGSSSLGWVNRGWFEIIYGIVTESWDGALKTHLMNKCNLNSRQVENYLHFLLQHKLLESQRSYSNRMIYKTTELGRRYIEIYRQMSDFLLFQPEK